MGTEKEDTLVLLSDGLQLILSKKESKELEKLLLAAEAKRVELEKTNGLVDMCAIYSSMKGLCIGYFKKATTFTKMQCIDLMSQSRTRSAQYYFDTCIIASESNPLLLIDVTKVNTDDRYYLRALDWCNGNVAYAHDALKKK